MSDPMEKFRQVFFDESAEALDTIEQRLLGLDVNDVDPEVVNDIFRSAHSLKGGSATFGMSSLADFTHLMETLLDMIRAGTKPFSQDVVDCLFTSLDCLRNLVSHYQYGEDIDSANIDSVTVTLSELIEDDSAGSEASSGNESVKTVSDSKEWEIAFYPDEDLLLTGNEPLRYIEELAGMGSLEVQCQSESVPKLDQLNPLKLKLGWDINLKSESSLSADDFEEVFSWIEDEARISYKAIGSHEVKVETPVTAPSVFAQAQTTQSAATAPAGVKTDASKGQSAAKTKKTAQSIRVELTKIDSLINLLGELVITQSMLSTFNDVEQFPQLEHLQEGLNQLERHTRELQDGVMQIRMLPIDFCFSRFPRMVRDLCKQLNKEIEVQIVGETTEVDKTVIEELTDPLVHLVRNSIDHGIEMPDDREAKGKPRKGILELKAFHQVGNIIIEVSDDGQGLQVEKIRQKAIEKGVIEESAKMSPQAIKELVFAPGFSTAEAVTDLSGRGVGMDVVKRNIQSLGGQIEVRSEPDEGTTFSIRLPLTLSILDGQLVKVAGETYVIPLLAVIESIQIGQNAINKVGRHDVSFKWRSQFIPLLSLKDTFALHDDMGAELDNELVLVVVVEHDNQQFGIIVDELANHQQVVVKSLEANYISISELSGATILGDGSVALILDVGELVNRLKVH